MKGLTRRNDDDHATDATADVGTDCLPAGVDPPPEPRLTGVGWAEDVETNARLGIPRPGCPTRPLPQEEAVERAFKADMHELTKWQHEQEARVPALAEEAAGRGADLTVEIDRLEREIGTTRADVQEQRDQLTDRDLRFAPGGRGSVAAALGVLFFAGLEVVALQPIVGQVVRIADWKAWGLSAFAVAAVGSGSWLLGSVLHRAVTYEGPARIRRLHNLAVLLLAAIALAAVGAIVGIRVLGRDVHTTAGAAVVIGLLYATIQGAVQLGAIVHGWWHHNPRVRQLRDTVAHQARLENLHADLRDQLREVELWAEALAGIRFADWVSDHRAQLAEDYAEADLSYRNALGQALLAAGQVESAEVLNILPLPRFVPPVETESGDSHDWLTGFVLPL